MLEQWWDRLATPIAQKMGISLDEFSRQMYAHSASGDWQEFADNAVKLKWVDVVVGRCRETAQIKNPDREQRTAGAFATNPLGQGESATFTPVAAKTDARAGRAVVLPRLNPLDCYYLYDPEGVYRTE
jgi:ATP-dependent Clp protease protease subunit